ncbi:hypothetical protein [Martelella sp. AMO21009]
MSKAEAMIFIFAIVLLIGVGWLTIFLTIKSRLSAVRHSRIETAGEVANIPLVAAFSGWRGVPWICWSSSDLKPTLILHADHIECRVIRRRRKPYDVVSRVDYRQTVGTANIVLEFSDSLSSFVGNTGNRDIARDAIKRLAEKGCPLSGRASDLLDR